MNTKRFLALLITLGLFAGAIAAYSFWNSELPTTTFEEPSLSHIATYALPEGTHRPEILIHEDSLYMLMVHPDMMNDIKHKGYIYDASEPSAIDFDNPETSFVASWITDEYGEGADHRVAIVDNEIWVVVQSLIMDEEKRDECVGGPSEPCTERQSLMLYRFTLEGEEILMTEIANTDEFPEDNYPDMCVLANGETLLVSTGMKDGDRSSGLKIREVDENGNILETYTFETSAETIPGSIGNSLFRSDDGLLMFSGSFNQISVTTIDETFTARMATYFELPDEENTFQTGVVYKDGYYFVGYSARGTGELAIESNPLSPRLMVLDSELQVAQVITVSEEAGSGHVHPTLAFKNDTLFYTWSKDANGMPQVMIEVFDWSQ